MALKEKDFNIKFLYKIYLILRRFIKSFNIIPNFIFKFFHIILKNSKKSRGLFFENSNENYILSTGEETYIVSTKDKVIAKSIYVKKQFDIDKFFIAKNILKISTENLTLVDIGANVGSICIPLVNRKLVTNAIAIEPDPLNFKLLKANVILNSLEKDIVTIETAVGENSSDIINFELSKLNHGDHRVHTGLNYKKNEDEKNRDVITVNLTNLDTILAKHNFMNCFIWMDTQGYEGFVLKGALNTLQKAYPIVMEFWPHGMNGSNSYQALKEAIYKSPYNYFYDLSDINNNKIVLNENNLDILYRDLENKETHTDILLSK